MFEGIEPTVAVTTFLRLITFALVIYFVAVATQYRRDDS